MVNEISTFEIKTGSVTRPCGAKLYWSPNQKEKLILLIEILNFDILFILDFLALILSFEKNAGKYYAL